MSKCLKINVLETEAKIDKRVCDISSFMNPNTNCHYSITNITEGKGKIYIEMDLDKVYELQTMPSEDDMKINDISLFTVANDATNKLPLLLTKASVTFTPNMNDTEINLIFTTGGKTKGLGY